MPIYEYECENKHRFEKWQSMKDDAIKECPECGTSVRKILHPAGIIFKGSGWYITDSRKPSEGASESESKTDKGEAKGGTKSEGSSAKSEATSDTKTEPKSAAGTDSSGNLKSESKSSSSSE